MTYGTDMDFVRLTVDAFKDGVAHYKRMQQLEAKRVANQRRIDEQGRRVDERIRVLQKLRYERNDAYADVRNLAAVAEAYAWALDDLAKHHKIPREQVEQKVLEYRERLTHYTPRDRRVALHPEEDAMYRAMSLEQQGEFDFVGSPQRKPRFLDWLDTKVAQERVEASGQTPTGPRTKRASGVYIYKDLEITQGPTSTPLKVERKR